MSTLRLGILGDSHGNVAMMTQAVAALRARGAGYVIHCGDIGSAGMLDLFQVIPNQYAAGFIFGNDDVGQIDSLGGRAKQLGIHCFDFFGEFEMAGKKFAVVHGDDQHRVNELVKATEYDFVLHGHTHVWRDEQIDAGGKIVRVINPGALALKQLRSNAEGIKEATCGLLDLETGRLKKIILFESH